MVMEDRVQTNMIMRTLEPNKHNHFIVSKLTMTRMLHFLSSIKGTHM
jgi:hypothetical protein